VWCLSSGALSKADWLLHHKQKAMDLGDFAQAIDQVPLIKMK
jgi:hypothetical protein